MQEETRRVLQELLDTVTSVNTSTEKYGESLEQYGTKLEDKIELFELQQLIKSLLSETQHMQKSYGRLKKKLEASTKEVMALRKKLQSAQKEAETDPLTGLLNRKGFKNAMRRALNEAAESHDSICLLMLDIDHFKGVNDTYGHAFGDAVLKAVASTLQKSVKGQDTVSRFGGEEFAIILPNTPRKGAQQVAENIRQTIERGKIQRSGNNEAVGNITISIGVAEFRQQESIEDLINRADTALYAAKNSGRNRVTVD
jgi:diguanylate cyclase